MNCQFYELIKVHKEVKSTISQSHHGESQLQNYQIYNMQCRERFTCGSRHRIRPAKYTWLLHCIPLSCAGIQGVGRRLPWWKPTSSRRDYWKIINLNAIRGRKGKGLLEKNLAENPKIYNKTETYSSNGDFRMLPPWKSNSSVFRYGNIVTLLHSAHNRAEWSGVTSREGWGVPGGARAGGR